MSPNIDPLEEAKRQAEHPAWELSKTGLARMKREYVAFYVGMFVLVCIGYLDPAQVLFLGSGYAEFFHLVHVLAAACVILTGWVMWPWQQRNDGSILGRLVAFPLLCGCVYAAVLFISFTTVPKFATLVATKPGEVTLDVISLRRESNRSSRRALVRLFEFDTQWYQYELEGQPQLIIFYWQSADDFTVLPNMTLFGIPEIGRFSGQRNWFGLRVDSIEKFERPTDASDAESNQG